MPDSFATFEDKDLGLKAIVKRHRTLKKRSVVAGVTGPAARAKHRTAGVPVAHLAVKHEFGHGKTPPRPFMSTAIDENLPTIRRELNKVHQGLIHGGGRDEGSLRVLGHKVASLIRRRISQGVPPPLSKRSIERKRLSAPRHMLTPLRETDQMFQAIVGKVLKRG